LIISLFLISNTNVFATADMHLEPIVGSKELQSIKQLAGKWEGTATEVDGKTNPATAEYQVTSNGSAVEEKLFTGTPHEMTSLYYDTKGELMFTHYCAIGNQPMMKVKSASDKAISLDYIDSPGIDVSKDMHMHSLEIAFVSPNEIVQKWTSFQNGQQIGTTTIDLKRVG
jgi:hypothetical protein